MLNFTNTTVDLSWTASTDNVGVTEYEIFSNNSSVGTVTGTTANITGLTDNNTYQFYVKAKDAAGNISAQSNSVSVTTGGQTEYCESKGSDSSYEWIDFNQNGTFESSENVVSGSSSSANELYADINIPSSASLGQTRMRVSMKYNANATTCETFTYGEVEDYTVNITNTAATFGDFANFGGEMLEFEEASFLLFPNPANSFVKIKIPENSNINVEVYNIMGEVLKNINLV